MKAHPSIQRVTILILLTITLSPASAKEFQWKFNTGDQFLLRIGQSVQQKVPGPQDQEVTINADMNIEGLWRVTKKSPQGEMTIEQRFKRLTMSLKMPGQNIEVDSADEKSLTNPTGKLFAGMLKQMKDVVIIRKMTSLGKTLETQTRLPEGSATGAAAITGMSPDQFNQMAKDSLLTFPKKNIDQGERWTDSLEMELPNIGKAKVITEYTYVGSKMADGKTLDLFEGVTKFVSADAAAKDDQEKPAAASFTGKGTKTVLFDAVAGRIESVKTEQELVVKQTLFGQSVTINVKLSGTSTLKPTTGTSDAKE